jgi:predicted RNA-binding protein YlxR (DUF448 family)
MMAERLPEMSPAPGRAARIVAEAGERRCLVTREAKPRADLVRFVVGPEQGVVPDVAERLPGRGLWVSATRAAVEAAVKGGLFARAAKAPVRAPADLADQVERLLAERALGLLGMARRAGVLSFGHDRVSARLAEGRAGLLVEAADAAPDGAARMAARARGLPVIRLFSRVELGAALGRAEIVHLAFDQGALAAAFAAAAARLAGFRPAGATDQTAASGGEPTDGIE